MGRGKKDITTSTLQATFSLSIHFLIRAAGLVTVEALNITFQTLTDSDNYSKILCVPSNGVNLQLTCFIVLTDAPTMII